MNKKSKITSLTAAALASVILAGVNVSQEVKADTQPAGTATKASSAVDNAQANVASAQKEVEDAQAKVDNASSALTSANSSAQTADDNYAAQENIVSNAQKDVNSKSKAVDDASKKQSAAQKLADEAKKPGAIDNAKQAVADKNAEIATKQDAVKEAQSKLPAANKAVSDAQSTLNDKNATLKDKQDAKADADQKVKDAEDALKGTGITEAKDNLDKANAVVAQDQKNKTAADNNVDKAQAAKNTAEQAKTAADNAKNAAIETEANDKTDYDTKSAAASTALDKVNAKKAEITDLTNQISKLQDLSKNTINLGDVNKFKQAYVDYTVTGNLTQDDIDYINSARQQNKFVSSDKDNEEVDLNNMTDDQIKDLSLFTSNVLDKVRKQLGLNVSDDEVNAATIDFAKKVAQRYNQDLANGSWKVGWHDGTGINDLAKENGLDSNEKSDRNTEQPYEDMNTFSYAPAKMTMDELKSSTYDSLLDMILPSGEGHDDPSQTTGRYEMAHTRGLLGLSDFKMDDNTYNEMKTWLVNNPNGQMTYDGKTYKSVDELTADYNKGNNVNYQLTNDDITPKEYVSTVTTRYPDGTFQIHFFNISPDSIKDASKFGDTTAIPSYSDQIDSLNNSLDTKNTELNELTEDYNTKKTKSDNAYNAWQAAKDDLAAKTSAATDAESKLTEATNKLTAATDKQKEVNDKLTTDEATQKAAQDRYNTLTASNEEKAKNLDNAKAAQTDAEKAVQDAQKAADQAQSELTAAKDAQTKLNNDIKSKQDAVKKAQDELKSLEQHVTDLENAPENLDKANKELADAENNLKSAQDTLATEQAKLNDLKNAKDSADSSVASAQAAYDQAQNDLKSAQDKLANAQNALKSIQAQEAAKNSITTPSTTSSTGNQTLIRNARIYDKNGKATTDTNGKIITLKKGTKINGKLVTIDGKKYYQIGENEFIKAGNVKIAKTTTKKTSTTPNSIKLTHTAFIYNKNGKVVRKGLKISYIMRGKTIKPLKTVTIKGKKYYKIGKNKYVKVANTKLKTNVVKFTATVKGKKNAKVATYNRSGKKNKHYVYGKKSYKFNEKITVKGKVYYKIAGKNDWVPAKKLNLKK